MSENPFVVKANKRREHQRSTMMVHLRALTELERCSTGATADRIRARVQEAKTALEAIGE